MYLPFGTLMYTLQFKILLKVSHSDVTASNNSMHTPFALAAYLKMKRVLWKFQDKVVCDMASDKTTKLDGNTF